MPIVPARSGRAVHASRKPRSAWEGASLPCAYIFYASPHHPLPPTDNVPRGRKVQNRGRSGRGRRQRGRRQVHLEVWHVSLQVASQPPSQVRPCLCLLQCVSVCAPPPPLIALFSLSLYTFAQPRHDLQLARAQDSEHDPGARWQHAPGAHQQDHCQGWSGVRSL